METLIQDIRYAVRMLIRRPGFTLIAVASLALGIGANTVVFSLVNTVLLRPLPIRDPARVFSLYDTSPNSADFSSFSHPDYVDLSDRNDVLSGLAAYRFAPMSLSHNGHNERIWGYLVTGNYFDVLGVDAAMGRTFLPEEDKTPGSHPVAMLSYSSWQRRFNSDPGIIDSAVTLNGRTFTIVGVAPRGFNGTEIAFVPEIYVPIMMAGQIEPTWHWLDARSDGVLLLIGRLKAEVSKMEAQASLNVLIDRVWREYPRRKNRFRVALYPPGLFTPSLRGPTVFFSAFLMVIVGLVLLVACSNLACLLLARAAERRKEIATRLAVGAGRLRLIRQLLTESILLSVLGGTLGLLLALGATRLVSGIKPPMDFALTFDLKVDYRVLVFVLLLSLATGIFFGLAPALQSSKGDLVSALKNEMVSGHYRRSLLRNALVVAQVALSLVLLVAAGLIIRSLGRAEAIRPGFNPLSAVQGSFDVALQGYDSERGIEFDRRLIDKVNALPGVESASLAHMLPLGAARADTTFYVEGEPLPPGRRSDEALQNSVWPGYFQTMQIPVLEGREFGNQDKRGAQQVLVVNEEFGLRYVSGRSPLGKRVSFAGPRGPFDSVIVGVARNGKYLSLGEDPTPMVYLSLLQSYESSVTLVTRTHTDPTTVITPIRGEISQMDPDLPVYDVKPLRAQLDLPLLPTKIAAGLLTGFGLLALSLATIGIYGVVSYAARQRTREIGIRMALGATREDVLRLMVRQGMVVVTLGLALGLVVAWAITRFISGFLYGVSPTDPLTFALVSLALALAALIACYLPARRSTRLDPMRALRSE